MILQENYTLSNGVEIPKLGLGTWFINDPGLWWETESEINVLNGMAFHP